MGLIQTKTSFAVDAVMDDSAEAAQDKIESPLGCREF
jgi:hypothetical protein